MWTLAGDGTQVEPANEATEDLTRQTATDELGYRAADLRSHPGRCCWTAQRTATDTSTRSPPN